jgi:hypothetical protein
MHQQSIQRLIVHHATVTLYAANVTVAITFTSVVNAGFQNAITPFVILVSRLRRSKLRHSEENKAGQSTNGERPVCSQLSNWFNAVNAYRFQGELYRTRERARSHIRFLPV